MKRILLLLGILLIGVMLFACAPRVVSVEKATSPEALAQEAQAPGKEVWPVEWEKTLALAKKEGKVVVYGPPGAELRRALTEEFQKAYPIIAVEYVGASGALFAPKIEAERRAGIYMVDLNISGTNTILVTLKKYAVPINPLLILPEVKDGKNWLDGELHFADKELRYNLVFITHLVPMIAYNTKLLDPWNAERLSLWDLIKPEYKGKVLWYDPRIAGPGSAMAAFIHDNLQLGADYLRALAKNEVILGRDQRLMMEWVGRGKYSVQLSPSSPMMSDLIAAGMPMKLLYRVNEGSRATSAFGSVIYLDGAPHPNAAKVYLNWLLSKEGQTAYSKASIYASRRLDVPTGHLDPASLVAPGEKYYENYTETGMSSRFEAEAIVHEIFGK